MVRLLDCDASGISMYDEGKRIISFPFVYNLPNAIRDIKLKLDADIFSEVIHTGKASRIDNYQTSPGKIEVIADAGLQAIAVLPLRVRGRILALLWATNLKPGRSFSDYDMALLESIGNQAAVAIDNFSLFEEQRYISEVLQRGFLPEHIPALAHTDIGIFYASATEAAVVGGDFYDFIPMTEGKVGLVIGDSSGKGVEATADAAMVKYTMRSALFLNPSPASALSQGNSTVARQLIGGHFVTLIYGYYDEEEGRLLMGIAGHPRPIHYSASERKAKLINGQDPAFGLIRNYSFAETELFLSPGDILILYTDGLIELRRDKEFLGTERLSDIIAVNSGLAAQEIANKAIDSARDFSMGRFTDDIVLMVIKRTG
ncbi:MAG: SpoIIE family protein phosphatase [Actinobacteria bacterium]|nr:SpoIIE family protein phosphatase [Actinomycetota bacterium]